MPNYSVTQCLEIAAVPADVKTWLEKLSYSKLPTVKDRVFNAQNQTELLSVLSNEYNKFTRTKLKRDAKNAQREECFEVLRKLIGSKAVKDQDGNLKKEANPQIISPEELLPRLQALKEAIEQEKKFIKIDKALEATGMTKEQLIEYLQGK